MFGETVANARIYVIKKKLETLLSGRLCEELGIIEFNGAPTETKGEDLMRGANIEQNDPIAETILQHPRAFEGIGTSKDHTVHFYIDSQVPPVAKPPRPVLFHLREWFDKEIQSMEEAGIIEEHHGPAPWVSNVVLSPKDDGGIRVTIDLREANRAIQATNIPIPCVENVKTRLSGCKMFSKLDLRQAFHQLELDEESHSITVFHAGDRLMRYRRLTMGAKPASEELNKALSPIFQDIPYAHVIHDDIIIGAPTKEQHDHALEKVLTRIEESGLTLNASKCILAKDEIPFWGMTVTRNGIKPDPSKVEALKNAGRPRSKEEVMSFLCFVQSFSDFIPIYQERLYISECSQRNMHASNGPKNVVTNLMNLNIRYARIHYCAILIHHYQHSYS